MAKPVIDVSVHNGNIDWARAKDFIYGAIIRCGYGSDYTSQDDQKWTRNVTECEKLGIPYAVYLYSYALSTEQARSEAEHTLRLVKGHKPSVIYFDSEEPNTRSVARANAMVYIAAIKAAGYKCGVYASTSWYKSYLNGIKCDSLWIAAYGSNDGTAQQKYRPNLGEDLWQYSSVAVIPGVGKCDVNIMYKNIFNAIEPAPAPDTEDTELLNAVAYAWGDKYNSNDVQYKTIQKRYLEVIRLLVHIAKADTNTLVKEVMANKYGKDPLRKNVLGPRRDEVQDAVNKLYA